MNEAETRAELIDPALAAAGWGVAEGSRIRREYPITLGRLEGAGKRGKPLTADYVLEYRNTKLAVVEAKALDKGLTEGVAQAKDYAGKLAVRFTYTSNGQGIYGIDMQTAVEGERARFPTPNNFCRLPDCLEAVSEPVEPDGLATGRRSQSLAAHTVSRRSQPTGRPSLQRPNAARRWMSWLRSRDAIPAGDPQAWTARLLPMRGTGLHQ